MSRMKRKSHTFIGQYIRKKRLEKKLMKYYLHNNRDRRTPVGKIIDALAGSILFIFIFYMLFINMLNNSTWSLILTALLFLLLLFLLRKRRIYKYNKIKIIKNRELSYKYAYQRIMELNHREFMLYIQNILVRVYPDLNLERQDNKQGPKDVIYRSGQKEVLLRCRQDKPEKKVGIDDIRDFCNTMKGMGISRGCFITTSVFDETSIDFTKSITNLKISLIDKDQILQLIERAGLLPDEQIIENLVIKEIKEEERKWHVLKREVLMPKKVKLYAITGIRLLLLSKLIPYTALYIIPGIICLGLAAIIYFSGLKTKVKDKEALFDEMFNNRAP